MSEEPERRNQNMPGEPPKGESRPDAPECTHERETGKLPVFRSEGPLARELLADHRLTVPMRLTLTPMRSSMAALATSALSAVSASGA